MKIWVERVKPNDATWSVIDWTSESRHACRRFRPYWIFSLRFYQCNDLRQRNFHFEWIIVEYYTKFVTQLYCGNCRNCGKKSRTNSWQLIIIVEIAEIVGKIGTILWKSWQTNSNSENCRKCGPISGNFWKLQKLRQIIFVAFEYNKQWRI